MAACNKNELHPVTEVLQSPVNSRINKCIYKAPSTLFICGGQNQELGFIYKSTDLGKSFKLVHYENGKALYDLLFVNDSTVYACGENMLLLKSTDTGNSFSTTHNEQNSDAFYNGTLYALLGDEKLLYVIGGKNYTCGIINWVKDNTVQTYWTGFRGFSNELRCGSLFANGDYLALGYGTLYKSKGHSTRFEPTDMKGDFFTSCCTINATSCFACGYNGGIYKITQNETKVETLLKPNSALNSRIHFNSMAFVNENFGWLVGNRGLMYQTTNGKDFERVESKTKENLLSVTPLPNNKMLVSTESGKLLVFNY